MMEQLYKMKEIIQNLAGDNRLIWERTESYWWNSVNNNLAESSGSFLGSMTNFSDTLKELKEHIEEENAMDEDDKKQDEDLENKIHPDDCDCIECTARREPGGLDHDPSEIVES